MYKNLSMVMSYIHQCKHHEPLNKLYIMMRVVFMAATMIVEIKYSNQPANTGC